MTKPVKPTADKYGAPELSRSMHGGYLKDLKRKRHFRLFNADWGFIRPVKVTILRYPVGQHYYVCVEEAHNAIWDDSDPSPPYGGGWRTCWDDTEGRGHKFEKKFDTMSEVEDFIVRHKEKYFPPSTHVLIRDEAYNRVRFVRRVRQMREGD